MNHAHFCRKPKEHLWKGRKSINSGYAKARKTRKNVTCGTLGILVRLGSESPKRRQLMSVSTCRTRHARAEFRHNNWWSGVLVGDGCSRVLGFCRDRP